MRSGLLLGIGLAGLLAAAPARASGPCQEADVHHLQRPYFPDRGGETRAGRIAAFDYSYELYRAARPGYPTILELTGGPGQTLIGRGERVERRFPDGFGIVLLDPRGVGCNKPTDGRAFPLDFYDTKYVAMDTLAVVRDLHLSHYLLFGSSYGSMVATEAAALAERSGETKPEAVVIEGVLGRAFRPGEAFEGFVKQWDAVRKRVPQATRAALEREPLPLGLTHDELGSFIAGRLLFRYRPSQPEASIPDPGFQWLSVLSGTDGHDAEKRRLVQAAKEEWRNANSGDPDVVTMYRAIACRELALELWGPNMDVALRLEHGRLAPVVKDLCRGLALDRPYDAKDWKITAPIYYFVGSKDPSTPPPQAAYHFAAETGADRYFVRIPEGGHSAMSSSLYDCQPALFEAIAEGGDHLEEALSRCRFSTELRHTRPEPSPLLASHRAPGAITH